MREIFELHADICKTFTHSKRLEIINTIRNGEMTASQLLKEINISKANLSQHMALLVQKGVVSERWEGKNVFYRLSDKRIIQACDLMREVLIMKIEKENKILRSFKNRRKR